MSVYTGAPPIATELLSVLQYDASFFVQYVNASNLKLWFWIDRLRFDDLPSDRSSMPYMGTHLHTLPAPGIGEKLTPTGWTTTVLLLCRFLKWSMSLPFFLVCLHTQFRGWW